MTIHLIHFIIVALAAFLIGAVVGESSKGGKR